MKLSDLRDLLLTIEVPVFHYHASKQPDKYIVWAEDTEGTSISANNKKINQSIQGTIDYFTKTEFDPNVDYPKRHLTLQKFSGG